ncbi:MAG: YraN family protein [Pirellulales bacterium]
MRIRTRLTGWLGRFTRRKTLGQRGESAAERFLKRLGYKIVARAQRTSLGEVDLVAVDGRTVVFVEVKTRMSHDAGHPADAVDAEKQRRLTRWALGYLRHHGLLDYPARFDVVSVTWPAGRRRPTIEHFKNAFEAVGQGQMFS